MSTFNPFHNTPPIYEAVRQWVNRSFLRNDSILSAAPDIWTLQNLAELDLHYVQNLDLGEGDFLSKLEKQLEDASPSAKRLMAEITWLLQIFPSNIRPETKRENVQRVWSWAGDPVEIFPSFISDEVLIGIANAGTAYNTHRWREVVYAVELFTAWKVLGGARQEELLASPWSFIEWLASMEGAASRNFFHILPHLIFPEQIERIATRKDKERILEAFNSESRSHWRRMDEVELNQSLLRLRERLEAEEGKSFDFYETDKREIWQPAQPTNHQVPESRRFADALSAALSEFERVRTGPFLRQEPLWSHMEQTKTALEALAPIASRPYLRLVWSLGAGNWARVAWVSLLNTNVTRTTEKGLYGVFLVSQDLSRIYLTLALGVTDFMNRLGPTMGAQALIDRASELRERVPELEAAGFTLGNAIDLASDGRLPMNYQRGTVAFVEFARDELPSDLDLENYLEALMTAYDRIATGEEDEQSTTGPETEGSVEELEPYSVDQALNGLFMGRQEFERILSVWKHKKNLVLQGAPGVGKSFIARRLAYALIGAKDPKRVEAVQFHQSYGYEDFVQGYRPDGAGGFARYDGNFHRFCSEAIAHPDRSFVFLIDEINRGNLSKIFGELMLLMEADKRSSEWAVQLAYTQEGEPRFYIPDNVYLLGMMNTADRSLSMVDYALRRRFAFVTMDPQFASPGFRAHLTDCGIPDDLIGKIIGRMNQLNDAIAADRLNLGEGYRIGHSFFVPTGQIDDPAAWYRLTVETEIKPLLEEYWFDDRYKADQWVERLLAE